MNQQAAAALFSALRQANPEPRGDLVYSNRFELLVAVVLSAQATDKGVNQATPALFEAAPTPQAMAELGVDAIRELIRTIGLFNNKAKSLHALSLILLEKFNGEVPGNREDLESLPGVGRKTANVVLNNGFGQPTLAVDTHVFRVANRTGLAPGKTPLAVEKGLLKRIPEEFLRHAHHWLILQGRYVCKARRPLCEECLIHAWCGWPDKGPGPAGPTDAPAAPPSST